MAGARDGEDAEADEAPGVAIKAKGLFAKHVNYSGTRPASPFSLDVVQTPIPALRASPPGPRRQVVERRGTV